MLGSAAVAAIVFALGETRGERNVRDFSPMAKLDGDLVLVDWTR